MKKILLSLLVFCSIQITAYAQTDSLSWITFDTSNSNIAHNRVNSITFDGTYKWLGTANGLARFDDTTFFNYSTDSVGVGIPNNVVNSVSVQSGKVWVATNNGLASFDGDSTWVVYNTANSGLPTNVLWSVLAESPTDIWIGTFAKGMVHFNGDTTFTVYDMAGSGLPHNNVRSIGLDANGDKWIATEGGGVAHYKDSTFVVYDVSNSPLQSDFAHIALPDASGQIWMGTEGGVAVFDGDTTWNTYTVADGLPDNDVWTFFHDPDGDVWAGTWGGGLGKFNMGAWTTTFNTTNSFIADDIVWAVYVDAADIKWIGTDNGFNAYREDTILLTLETPRQPNITHEVYPNPVSGVVFFSFELPSSAFVELDLLNAGGQYMTNMVGEQMPAGRNHVQSDISQLPPGLYFSRLRVGESIHVRKLLIMQ